MIRFNNAMALIARDLFTSFGIALLFVLTQTAPSINSQVPRVEASVLGSEAATVRSMVGASSEDETCQTCHAGAAADFARSSKSSYMSCTDCHGTAHNGPDTGPPGIPSPRTCAECHADAINQFNGGKHYYGWEAMQVVPRFHEMPSAATDKGCVTCHKVGYVWEDGSRGRCDACHSRHLFSAAEARKPEACGTCHAGEHPQ